MAILELIHAPGPDCPRGGRDAFIRYRTSAVPALSGAEPFAWVSHDDCAGSHRPGAGDGSFEFLPYQLSTVGSWPTVVATGDGELGFDSGEGA